MTTRRLPTARAVALVLAVAFGMGNLGLVPPGMVGGGVRAESPGGYRADSEECAVLRQINKYRASKNERELVLVETLGAAAEHHSDDMARHNYFDHYLQGERINWDTNIRRHGYYGNAIGENIAAGNESAGKTFEQWKKSNGHNRNMLETKWRAIGIGRSYNNNSENGWYWTTTFGNEVRNGDVVRC